MPLKNSIFEMSSVIHEMVKCLKASYKSLASLSNKQKFTLRRMQNLTSKRKRDFFAFLPFFIFYLFLFGWEGRCRPSFHPRKGKCWLKKVTNTKAETNKQTSKHTNSNRQDKKVVQFLLRRNCPTAPQNFKMVRPLKDTCVWLDAEKAWRIVWIWHRDVTND